MALSEKMDFFTAKTAQGRLQIPYILKRVKGMKTMRLMLTRENVVLLKLPYGVSRRYGLEFLQQHADWIVQQHSKQATVVLPSLYEFLVEKGSLDIWDKEVTLVFTLDEPVTSGRFDPEAGKIFFFLQKNVDRDAVTKDMLRQFADKILKYQVVQLSQKVKQTVNRTTVRDQKSRWGSCSSLGNINLNWRLILLPARLQNYIIYHELAHLEQMNHSKDYWEILTSYDPDAREHDCEITEIGGKIMALGR